LADNHFLLKNQEALRSKEILITDRQDKKDKVKIFGVWRNHSCSVLMVLSYTSCISLFKKSLRPYGYWWSEVDNQIILIKNPYLAKPAGANLCCNW